MGIHTPSSGCICSRCSHRDPSANPFIRLISKVTFIGYPRVPCRTRSSLIIRSPQRDYPSHLPPPTRRTFYYPSHRPHPPRINDRPIPVLMASSSSPHSYGRLHSPNVADPKRRYHENSPSVHSEHHASLSPHDHWAVSVAPEPQDQISSAGLNNAVTTTVDSGQWVDYGALANEQFLRNDYTYDPYANVASRV